MKRRWSAVVITCCHAFTLTSSAIAFQTHREARHLLGSHLFNFRQLHDSLHICVFTLMPQAQPAGNTPTYVSVMQ